MPTSLGDDEKENGPLRAAGMHAERRTSRRVQLIRLIAAKLCLYASVSFKSMSAWEKHTTHCYSRAPTPLSIMILHCKNSPKRIFQDWQAKDTLQKTITRIHLFSFADCLLQCFFACQFTNSPQNNTVG